VGTGSPTSVLNVISEFEIASGQKLNIEFEGRRDGDVPILFANTNKIENILNWKCSKTLADACKDSVKRCKYYTFTNFYSEQQGLKKTFYI
jgi:UDP-glucose 4-epimerase